MKPTLEVDEAVPDNEDQFQDEFFKRFELRHGPEPLKLNDHVTRDYLFPTFYGNATSTVAAFLCSYKKAEKLMPHPLIRPARMTRGRSLVIFSSYAYANVMNVSPYNEVAISIPVMVAPRLNIPLAPVMLGGFKNFGYYIFSLPVTSLENQIRGLKIWGLPKVVQEIEILRRGAGCVTTVMEEWGEPYLEIRVPTNGKPTDFDMCSNIYSRLGDSLVRSKTHTKGTYNVIKFPSTLLRKKVTPAREYMKIHDTPSGRVLKNLEIEPQPIQLRYASKVNSCFDIPDENFTANAIKFENDHR